MVFAAPFVLAVPGHEPGGGLLRCSREEQPGDEGGRGPVCSPALGPRGLWLRDLDTVTVVVLRSRRKREGSKVPESARRCGDLAGGQAQRGHGARQAQRCMRGRERGRSGYLGTSDRNRSWLTLAQKECSGKIWVSPHNQQKMRRPRPRAGRWLGWPWQSRWPTPGGWTAEWTRAGMGGEGSRDRWWGGGESGGRESGCGETLAQEQGQPAGGRGGLRLGYSELAVSTGRSLGPWTEARLEVQLWESSLQGH